LLASVLEQKLNDGGSPKESFFDLHQNVIPF